MKINPLFICSVFILNLIAQSLFKIDISLYQIGIIYIFLFSLIVLTELIKEKILKENTGNVFALLSINLLRILISVIFLLPYLLAKKEVDKVYIYNFIICYLILLFSSSFINIKQIENK
jgi:small-conductance mechanosensitive channel